MYAKRIRESIVYKSDRTDKGVSERLHWIPMCPQHRERIYRRSGEKAIGDYFNARGHLPYATGAEKARSASLVRHI